MKDQRDRTNQRTPAFLSSTHRGLDTPAEKIASTHQRWTPRPGDRQVVKAIDAISKLTAQLGLCAIASDTTIEVLPGTPATVALVSKGKLMGLVVLSVDENEARRTLGLPVMTTRDIAADALFEEQREISPPDVLLAEAQYGFWEQ